MQNAENKGERNRFLSIPKSVNSEEDSGVEASMVDDLGLRHLQGLGHPVQEGEVSGDVEVDELADKVPGPAGTLPCPREVPFGEVDPVVGRLNPEQGECQKESKGTQDVNECRHPYVLQSRHDRNKQGTPTERERERD